MIHSLSAHARQRKGKLNTYLDNNKDEIKLEKQHQIYGALNELENIMGVLNKHKELEVQLENNPEGEVFLLKPIHSEGFVKDTLKALKDLF